MGITVAALCIHRQGRPHLLRRAIVALSATAKAWQRKHLRRGDGGRPWLHTPQRRARGREQGETARVGKPDERQQQLSAMGSHSHLLSQIKIASARGCGGVADDDAASSELGRRRRRRRHSEDEACLDTHLDLARVCDQWEVVAVRVSCPLTTHGLLHAHPAHAPGRVIVVCRVSE